MKKHYRTPEVKCTSFLLNRRLCEGSDGGFSKPDDGGAGGGFNTDPDNPFIIIS